MGKPYFPFYGWDAPDEPATSVDTPKPKPKTKKPAEETPPPDEARNEE